MSISSVLCSAAIRQTTYLLPDQPGSTVPSERLHDMLCVILDFPDDDDKDVTSKRSVQRSTDPSHSESCHRQGRKSRFKQYWWQVSVMLTSWSWVLYFLGLTLCVLAPVLKGSVLSVDSLVSPRRRYLSIIIRSTYNNLFRHLWLS
jgi:hypothetical protein